MQLDLRLHFKLRRRISAILMNPRGRERGRWRHGEGRGEDCADSAPRLREEVGSTGVYGHHGDGTDFGPSHLPLTLLGAPWQPDFCTAEPGPAGLRRWHTAAAATPIPRDWKMYSQRFGIVQREVKGPTPKVVIVVSTGCVCGTLLLSASPSTPGLAEPNLAQAVALSRGVGVLCSGLNFERRSEKAIHLVPVFCSSVPHRAPVIFRFCICRISPWDTESFQSPRLPRSLSPCDVAWLLQKECWAQAGQDIGSGLLVIQLYDLGLVLHSRENV